MLPIGHLHDDIIYYYDQIPSGFSFLFQITAFVNEISLGLPNLNYEEKNETDSGRSSKMTPSCKWPIAFAVTIQIFLLSNKKAR